MNKPAPPKRIVEQPLHLEAHQLVLVAPSSDKHIKYAHSIGENYNWKTTRCGISISDGFLWSVFYATLVQSDWCGECW